MVVSLYPTLCCPGPPRSPWTGRALPGERAQGLSQLRGQSWRVRCLCDCDGTRVWMLHQEEGLAQLHSADMEGGFVEGGFIRHPPGVPMCWPECLWQGTVPWSGSWSLAACHCRCCFSAQCCSPTHLAVARDSPASSLMPFPLAALAQTHFMDGSFKPPPLPAVSLPRSCSPRARKAAGVAGQVWWQCWRRADAWVKPTPCGSTSHHVDHSWLDVGAHEGLSCP